MDMFADAKSASTQAAVAKPKQPTAALALLALGVVYGDIGTSPLYAAKETFNPAHGIPLTAVNIIGGVSAIFWTLMIVVSLKYVTLMLEGQQPRRRRHHGAAGAGDRIGGRLARGCAMRCSPSACSAPRCSMAMPC